MVRKFRAKVFVFDLKYPITKGQDIEVHAFSSKTPGKIFSLDSIIDSKTGNIKKKKPKKLSTSDTAIITIKLESPVCLEMFKNVKSMGRIALRDVMEGEITIASGVIEEMLY